MPAAAVMAAAVAVAAVAVAAAATAGDHSTSRPLVTKRR
jgi:hypothetical protein